MTTFPYTLKYKSIQFYYGYKRNGGLKDIVLAILLYIFFVWFQVIIFISNFITDFIKSVKHGNLTDAEIAERHRLNTIAKENAAASFGYRVGMKRYYQRQREIKEYNNRPWWDK